MNGILEFTEQGRYELHHPNSGITDISSILETIYMHSESKYHINIKITNGCKTLFNEDGSLYLSRIRPKLYSYYVSGEDLETVLFNSVGKELDITIFAEALEGTDYGKQLSKR